MTIIRQEAKWERERGRDRERSTSRDGSQRKRNGAICQHATNIFPFLYRRHSYMSLTQWVRDSFKGHSVKRKDECITCGASNHPYLPSLISAACAQSVNPDGAAQAFTVRHDSLISDLDFQTELRSGRGYMPVAHQKHRLPCQAALLTAWRPPRLLCECEFQEEEGHFESAEKEDEE